MGELMKNQKAEASRRGWFAVAGWVGAGWTLFGGHFILGAIIAAVAVWLTKSWFNFRAKWGMRF